MDNDEGIKNTVDKIAQCLNNQITPNDEEEFLNSLISEFYTLGTDPITVEEIIRNYYYALRNDEEYNQKGNSNVTIENLTDFLDDVYTQEEQPNGGFKWLNTWIESRKGKKTALKTIRKLTSAINPYQEKQSYSLEVGSDKFVVLDQMAKAVIKERIVYKKGSPNLYDIVINAYPTEIIVHENPITDEGRLFSITWESKGSNRLFETKKYNIKDIEQSLEESGFIYAPQLLKGTIAGVIQIAIENELAIVKTEIDTPGFYYDNSEKKMISVDYDIEKPSKAEIKEAIDIINELKEWFGGQESKLAHCLKWGILSPFSYMMKQRGGFMNWLYLYGKSGTGKTTMAQIILYLWGVPNTDNEIGGSGFNTDARAGQKLSQFTFPVVVNEPGGVFEKDSVVDLIKVAVESTVSRSKYFGRSNRGIPAFASAVFTSNSTLPKIDGLQRRFDILNFSHKERKTIKGNEEDFEQAFKIRAPKLSVLNRLKGLSKFVAYEMNQDPSLIELNWKELGNTLLLRFYTEVGQSLPGWLTEWSKQFTLDDFDDEEIEEIRMFLIDQINFKNNQIKIYDEESGYPKQNLNSDSLKKASEFNDRVWNVLNERLIPWMIPYTNRDNKNYIAFTAGMKRDMHKYTEVCYPVKSIAELLEWEYKTVKLPKPTKVMSVKFEDFIVFLYPEFNESKSKSFEDNEKKEISEVT